MHLGLARAQLLPRSDGYRRFTGSPIDALVYLVGLSCHGRLERGGGAQHAT